MKKYNHSIAKSIAIPDYPCTITGSIAEVPILESLAFTYNQRKAKRFHKRCKKMGVKTLLKPIYTITK
jgi:hypothetical protein